MSEYIYQSHGEPLVNERSEIYLARAGEIVRCRDCKHWRRFYPESEQRFGTCCAWRYTTRFDGYCHNASNVDGERQSE